MFGVWPHAVRSISTVLCEENRVGFYVELDRNVLRSSVTVAESDMLRGYILFEVGAIGRWEHRVADWIANYWCVLIEELVPVGISCSGMPSLRRLLQGGDGRGRVLLDPVRSKSVMQVVTVTGLSVSTGQAVHVVMNFLLSKLRDCLKDPVLMACPALVRVSVDWVLFCFKTYLFLIRGGGCLSLR